MPQEAASGLVVVDPDASSSLPPSSSLPRTQLSPETLRALVLKCGREAEGEASCLSAAAPSTSNALKARDRLRGQLGFCFDPMPWEQAVAAIADGGVEAMGQMGRTPEGVARYWRWRDEVCAKEYASTADFSLSRQQQKQDGRKVAWAPPADAGARVIWRENVCLFIFLFRVFLFFSSFSSLDFSILILSSAPTPSHTLRRTSRTTSRTG